MYLYIASKKRRLVAKIQPFDLPAVLYASFCLKLLVLIYFLLCRIIVIVILYTLMTTTNKRETLLTRRLILLSFHVI